MTRVVAFEVRSELAHFRRPDTLGTHATYPFATRTVLRGLIAAVLGEGTWPDEGRVGLRLLAPVRTVAQELTLHGKTWEARCGRPESFHRPTAVELVVQPNYRVYTTGPHAEALADMLLTGRSRFPTYLGSAFCLTFPRWVGVYEGTPLAPVDRVTCSTVVPAGAVARLALEAGQTCARVGGVLLEHVGAFAERRFRGSTAVLYEPNGRLLSFEPAPRSATSFWEFYDLAEEGRVCLW